MIESRLKVAVTSSSDRFIASMAAGVPVDRSGGPGVDFKGAGQAIAIRPRGREQDGDDRRLAATLQKHDRLDCGQCAVDRVVQLKAGLPGDLRQNVLGGHDWVRPFCPELDSGGIPAADDFSLAR